MSRKDYKQFAEMLKRLANMESKYGNTQGRVEYRSKLEILRTIAEDMSEIFKRDNPNFSKDRFLSACEFPETQPVKL